VQATQSNYTRYNAFYFKKIAGHAALLFFGNPAVFESKILRFPSPLHNGFGFVGYVIIMTDARD
jgi:hypothetical protein